jgi:hypothetical protein
MSEIEIGSGVARDLWRRVSAAGDDGSGGNGIDAMLLAAFAEHRLDENTSVKVAAFLDAFPDHAEDVAAASRAGNFFEPATGARFEKMITRAAALVAGDGTQSGASAEIIAFRPRPRGLSAFGPAARWAALAASFALVAYLGFGLGSGAYTNFAVIQGQGMSSSHELIDPPGSMFSGGLAELADFIPGEDANRS